VSYGLAAVPAALMLAGVVLAVEMSYRLSTQPELGTRMRILYVAVEAATPWPWIGALAAIVIGFLLFRRTWPIVANAWGEAHQEAAAAKAAASLR